MQKLEIAGKKYHYLSPQWKNSEEKAIIFWLDLDDRKRCSSGWFTTKDLLDWIDVKGPVADLAKSRK